MCIRDSTWEARRGFTGGVVSSSLYAGDVLGTSDDALYRNSYYGMSAWKQAVPNGTYDVTLKMRDTSVSYTHLDGYKRQPMGSDSYTFR